MKKLLFAGLFLIAAAGAVWGLNSWWQGQQQPSPVGIAPAPPAPLPPGPLDPNAAAALLRPAGQQTPPQTPQVRPVDVSGETNLPTQRVQNLAAAQAQQLDPREDGWNSEVVAEQVEAQLHIVSEAILSPDDRQIARLQKVASPNFSPARLRPENLETVWEKQGMVVRRAAALGASAKESATDGRGAQALAAVVRDVLEPGGARQSGWCKFKTFRVELQKGMARTVSYLQASYRESDRVVQVNATWNCTWKLFDKKTLATLEDVRVEGFEEITTKSAATLFSDCTLAAVGKTECYQQQFSRGLNYWLQKIDVSYRTSFGERNGLAMADVNGDGLEDVYICQPSGLPNRLLVQDGTGAVVDESAEAGVDFLDNTSAALFADLDNDGDPDLILAQVYHVLVMENDGRGRFQLKADLKIDEWDVHALSAVDVDNDRDLDFFLCIATADKHNPKNFVYYDARDGGGNMLFRNDIMAKRDIVANADPVAKGDTAKGDLAGGGEWKFTEITNDVGLGRDNYRQSLAAAWEDFDNDGDQDLFIANDYGVKKLFRNDHGRFVEITAQAGVLDPGSGMSVSWGDYDRDGLMDLYVGNMFSAAGTRITTQEKRLAALGPQTRALLQRFAKGNSLFRNQGDGTFRETGAEAGVEMGRWAWSSLFADLNNDGWEDLYVANGFITNSKIDDL